MEQFINKYTLMTESEQRVFAYVYNNQTTVVSMKVQDLAAAALTSKTVIINMCQKLGFEGYGDLKYYLKNHKGEKIPTVSFNQFQYQLLEQVKKTMTVIDINVVRMAAQLIKHSRTVYIVARGASKPVGSYLEHLLLILGIKCLYLKDYNLISTVTKNIDINEIIINHRNRSRSLKLCQCCHWLHPRNRFRFRDFRPVI